MDPVTEAKFWAFVAWGAYAALCVTLAAAGYAIHRFMNRGIERLTELLRARDEPDRADWWKGGPPGDEG